MEELSLKSPAVKSTPEISPAMTPQQSQFTTGSGFSAYRELAIGKDGSLGLLVSYELCMLLLSNLPGILGFGLRSAIYPLILGGCGKRPAIGRGVVIRNPRGITFGHKVMIDDYAVLDVRGKAELVLGDFVSIGRFTTLAAKGGTVRIGNGGNIGSYCRIASQSAVEIGESVLVGAYSYIGPGNHQTGDDDKPLISRDMENKGGVRIGRHAWIGAGVTILDGVKIGERAIVGAHSLVLNDVPEGATVAGAPAKIIRS